MKELKLKIRRIIMDCDNGDGVHFNEILKRLNDPDLILETLEDAIFDMQLDGELMEPTWQKYKVID